jgi:NitT/TauT family transport system substrate-binding protein
MRSPAARWAIGIAAALVALIVLRLKPWQHDSTPVYTPGMATASQPNHTGDNPNAREALKVGFLPVTCHLTCPVTDFASRTSATTRFDSQRFTDFPTMVEAIKGGQLEATFMIVPLAMRLREQGVPVKICYLGHRDGSEIMVRKDLVGPDGQPVKDLRGLRGKTFAIPSRFSNQNLVVHKLMEDQGVKPDDIKFIEMPPPDMPTALASKAIDAYFVGEPFCAKAELEGSGRVLYYAKDIWPHFISCCLVVHEKLIKEKPEVVRDLVRGIAQSGEWAETHRTEAAKVVSPYFRQDEKVVKYVLTQPPDRVSYRMLTPTDEDLQKIEDMALRMKVLGKPVPMHELIDREFVPADIKPATIDMTKAGTMP